MLDSSISASTGLAFDLALQPALLTSTALPLPQEYQLLREHCLSQQLRAPPADLPLNQSMMAGPVMGPVSGPMSGLAPGLVPGPGLAPVSVLAQAMLLPCSLGRSQH